MKQSTFCIAHIKLSEIILILILISTLGFTLVLSVESEAQTWQSDRWANMRDIAPRGYVCYRAAMPIVIDGKIDDPSWRYAPWTDYFIDIEGDVKPRPRFRTQVKMLWDDDYFYIIADMQEPHVWGTLTEHDAVIYIDNDFEIFIDPNSDNCEYYEIEINALNTEWDLFLRHTHREKYKHSNDWEIPGLKTAVHVDGTLNDPDDIDRGWSVEFAIPWDVLGEYAHKPAPPEDGDQWRVNFSRVEWRHELIDNSYRKVKGWREDNWVWSPQGIIAMHCPEKWGYVQFSTGRPGTVKFRPDPTEPARILLNGIYYAQLDYKKVNNRYAAELDELKIDFGETASNVDAPVIELTGDGYRASVTITQPDGKLRKLYIRQDSKIVVE